MTLSDELEKLNISEMEKIKIIRAGEVVYYDTIFNLLNRKKVFLSFNVLGEIRFVVDAGLVAHIEKMDLV